MKDADMINDQNKKKPHHVTHILLCGIKNKTILCNQPISISIN